MLPTKIDDPPESLVDEAAISNEISCKKGCATGFVLHIRDFFKFYRSRFGSQSYRLGMAGENVKLS